MSLSWPRSRSTLLIARHTRHTNDATATKTDLLLGHMQSTHDSLRPYQLCQETICPFVRQPSISSTNNPINFSSSKSPSRGCWLVCGQGSIESVRYQCSDHRIFIWTKCISNHISLTFACLLTIDMVVVSAIVVRDNKQLLVLAAKVHLPDLVYPQIMISSRYHNN